MPRKKVVSEDAEAEEEGATPLGAGRTLRVREKKEYTGNDEPSIEEEEEPKKGKKRGRPPKTFTPKGPSTPTSGRPLKKLPPVPQKLRPFDPPVRYSLIFKRYLI